MKKINNLKKWQKLFKQKVFTTKKNIYQFFSKEKIVFGNHYIDTKCLYVYKFNRQPNIAEINDVKLSVVFDLIKSNKYGKVKSIFQNNEYNWDKNKIEYDKTIFIL